MSLLEVTGVVPIMGKFKEKDRNCRECGHHYKGHEEKETDVNIALHLIADADDDRYDTPASVVSRDLDLIPALRMVRSRRPDKKLILVAPPRLGHGNELELADAKRKIKEQHLADCRLPDETVLLDGSIVIRPDRRVLPS